METLYILAGIGLLILQIIMIVKFFQIAKNVGRLAENPTHRARYWYLIGDMQKSYEALYEAFILDVIQLSDDGVDTDYYSRLQQKYESKFRSARLCEVP